MKSIEVCVEQSSAGPSRRIPVAFSKTEATATRDSFRGIADNAQPVYGSSPSRGTGQTEQGNPRGRMLISQEEATQLGKRLAKVLFPTEVARRREDARWRALRQSMSELTQRRVLILGRFSARRLEVLKAIQAELARHQNNYVPELFTFRKPKNRDLVESIMGFAALSRFVIADLSEPKSVQSELEAIVPHFQSVPVVPLINQSGREYATFSSVRRRPNVVQPTVRYRSIDDLRNKLDRTIVPEAEARLRALKLN